MQTPIVKAGIARTCSNNCKPKTGGIRPTSTSESRSGLRGAETTDSPNYGSLNNHGAAPPPPQAIPSKSKFPYEEAYKKLLIQLSVHPSPMRKLLTLYELVRLVVSSLSHSAVPSRSHRVHSNMPSFSSESAAAAAAATPRLGTETRTVSRKNSLSAITCLSEAIAGVEAKRISSGAFPCPSPMLNGSAVFTVGHNTRGSLAGPNTDAIAEELRRVIKSVKVDKYHTLFRDLQFIAAFVPSRVLDLTDMGKAFWDVSLAALSLKEEYLRIVTETASEVFKYSTGMINPDMDASFLAQWSLQDCAQLWTIASKEGDTEAQRELAIMHFSHPHVAPICLAPFAKLSDTFTPAVLDDYRSNEDRDKLDPIRMCVIKHWMSKAAAHGDNIASEYLSQQEFSGAAI